MRNRTTTKLILGLLTTFSVTTASAQSAFVAGPVEHISVGSGQVTVLGQTYVIDNETVFATNGKRAFQTVGVGRLRVGDFVAIEAKTSVVPLKATSLASISTQYIPGASSVFVGGTVEQVSFEFATVRIGGLVVDISQASPEVLSTIQVGSFAQVAGIQPSRSGSLLGQQIQITPAALSIGGTGGTSLQSIGGTGGASLQSIGGTGGASLLSIGGTGGASLQSIGGTGGASLQSIGGTGGASLQSIGGTGGASLQSIGGTGSATLQ